jgi:AraC family transcriptional regulator
MGAMAMADQEIRANEVVDYPHEADVGGFSAGKLAISKLSARRSCEWVRHVLVLLDAAVQQLQSSEEVAQGAILEATALLRKQFQALPDGSGGLLAWQARKVCAYIDDHITGPVLVADLCALIDRSEAHFSRSFKRTFGESPHAFVIRRRLELAARYMLRTDASLSDIALQCGFTDQAHLCKHFRQAMGHTPAAWRRAQRSHDNESATPRTGLSRALCALVPAGTVRSNERQGRQF